MFPTIEKGKRETPRLAHTLVVAVLPIYLLKPPDPHKFRTPIAKQMMEIGFTLEAISQVHDCSFDETASTLGEHHDR